MVTSVLQYGIVILFIANVRCADNLALYKPANQTGAWGSLTANKAVDGRYGSSNGDQYYCAHPDNNNKPAEWWVDLQDTYVVENVTLYNTYDAGGYKRMTNFIISVGYTLDTRTDCGQPYTGTVPPGGHVTITCNIRGRFVHFRRLIGASEPWLVALCEVEVYGWREIDCSRCPVNIPCSGITGCSQCDAGKLPPDCVRDCPDMRYGVNCSSVCGKCRYYKICDKSDGFCPSNDGCELWFAGQRCDVDVVVPQRTSEVAKLGQVTNGTIEVIWEQIKNLPSVEEGYYKYRVDYRRVGATGYQTGLIVLHNTSTWISATITSLDYNTQYEIRVTPYREIRSNQGEGNEYNIVTGKTKCGVPASPNIKHLNTESAKTGTQRIKVEYESLSTLDPRCEYITATWIDYQLNGTEKWLIEPCDVNNTTCVLSPPSGGTYEVRVTVQNNGDITSSSNVKHISVQGPQPSINNDNGTHSKQVIMIIIPIVVIVVLLIAVLLFVFVYLRKKKFNFHKKKQRPTIEILNDGTSNAAFIPSTPSPTLKTKQNHNSQKAIKPSPPPKPGQTETPASGNKPMFTIPEPVDVSEFDEYVKNKKRNMSIFSDEYKTFPPIDKYRCKLAVTTKNRVKNRFANIYAYDENRVILQTEEDEEEDYINANYITGYNGPKDYIATQGPKSNTVVDLWRMIWQENVNRIVMLANLVDDGKQRCSQYWPESGSEAKTVGKFTIHCESIQKSADYTTRILIVKKGKESRKVRQFHFTSWEDKNKPLNGAITLFAFYNKVHSFDRMSTGPMVVHCSAGVGRTGTFIAFDILVKQAAAENKIDIYGWITKLRGERMLMVQTKDQYIFLHDALAEYFKCGNTSYPCNNFMETFSTISTPSEDLGGISEVDKQYNLLVALNARPESYYKDGLRETNKAKNRDLEIIPDDDNRPYLSTRYKQGNNYINAVYVPSFREHDYYIVTQMPLTQTIVDLWRLVRDADCHAIVMLNELDHEDETCQAYWPDEDEPKQRYGPLEVELMNINLENTSKNIITRDFRVILASEKKNVDDENTEIPGLVVRQFQLLSWTKDNKFPPNKSDLLDLFEQLQKWQNTRVPNDDKVKEHCIIHCMNGAERSGIFCGASYVVDKVKADQEVDAFLAARYVGKKRPQFFKTKEQYTFLYEMAVESSSLFHEYANI